MGGMGFIENNKYYNSSFNSNIQNKRVYPTPHKILPNYTNTRENIHDNNYSSDSDCEKN